MLCPEVWDFRAPQHNFKVDRTNCQTKRTTVNLIDRHYFNHSVSIVLPDTVNLPTDFLEDFNRDSDYYRIDRLRVTDLVDKEFVEAFVKRGEVTLLAVGCNVDVGSSVALTPSGHLILSLTKQDFQELGLEGKASFFDRGSTKRFVVTIDLKDEKFSPGTKYYDRVRRCLDVNLRQTFDVVLAWDPPEEKLCPSSIAAWFDGRNYTVKICHQCLTKRNRYSLDIPLIENQADPEKLFEWLGVFCVDGQLSKESENSYVSEYCCPQPSLAVGQARFLQWTGFLTRKQVREIFEELVKYVRSRSTLPWAGFDVQGFQDSPVSYELKEHTFFVDGDNSFAIFLKPEGECILRTSLSSNNKSRIRQ